MSFVFQPDPREKVIIELPIEYINDDNGIFSQPGVLIVTTMRIVYYRRTAVKKVYKFVFSEPLQTLKVKFKKSWPHYQYLVIDKRDLAIYGYDNKLVAKWLNDLSKQAKKSKGEIPMPKGSLPFVAQIQQEGFIKREQTNNQLATPMTLPRPNQIRQNPSNNTSSSQPPRFCTNCGEEIVNPSKFCIYCGSPLN